MEDYELLLVPGVVRPYVTERVLTLEYIERRKPLANHDLAPEVAAELARQFFNAYVHQVVVEGVYHADPHSGNVLLTDDGPLALLDFGLLGRLDDDTRRGLSLLLLAIAQNRADDVSDLIISLSLTSVKSDQPAFVQDVRRKLPRFHWRPLSSIHAGESLADLQRIALEHSIALPTSFALVGKTLAQADSIARVLYPELDPIALMEDEALEVMMIEAERRLEPNRPFAYLYTQLDPLTRMPRRLGHVLAELEQGSLKVGVVPTGLDELGANLRSVANRTGAAIIIGSLLLASALLARVHRFEWMAFAGFSASQSCSVSTWSGRSFAPRATSRCGQDFIVVAEDLLYGGWRPPRLNLEGHHEALEPLHTGAPRRWWRRGARGGRTSRPPFRRDPCRHDLSCRRDRDLHERVANDRSSRRDGRPQFHAARVVRSLRGPAVST